MPQIARVISQKGHKAEVVAWHKRLQVTRHVTLANGTWRDRLGLKYFGMPRG